LIENSYNSLYWEVIRANLPHNNNIQLVYKNDKSLKKKNLRDTLLKNIEIFHNNPEGLKIIKKLKGEINLENIDYDLKKF